MEINSTIGSNVDALKNSLDDLEHVAYADKCSTDSLKRLSSALEDINEEVNLLRSCLQSSLDQKNDAKG